MKLNELHWKSRILVAIAGLTLLAAFLARPIPQDPDYHRFADARTFATIPNVLNVLSNLPFLLVGAMGLVHCLRQPGVPQRLEWSAAFIGIALVAAGSAYYHGGPTDETLVWDRLPMTLGFMAVLAALLGESVGAVTGRAALLPLLGAGVGSVWYWQSSGDLWLYAWVQFMPLVMAVAILLLYRGRVAHPGWLVAALVCYGLAKIAEAADRPLYEITGHFVSGHTLKHLAAALACGCLVQRVRGAPPRQPRAW